MKNKDYILVLQKILQLIEEGVHVVDAEGKTVIYNDAMSALESMESQDVMSRPLFEVFKHLDKEDSSLFRALKEQKSTPWQEQHYLNKDGKPITAVNRALPVVRDGEVIAAIEIARNVTQIQQMSDTILSLQNQQKTGGEPQPKKVSRYSFSDLWGHNQRFVEVLNQAKSAAGNDASVFIYGETGTGKELLAQSIHYDSRRKTKPFLAQNCAALPAGLLEGLLFGTSRGGFTGATDREGIFEQANGGTLLLDEINSMPYELQGKLLRVLQENYIRRVGGTRDIPVDVRIIATINEPVEDLLRDGRLRRDLYYRLNVISLRLPPLRDRKDDILLLAKQFIERYNYRLEKEIWSLSEDAEQKLLEYSYPGNVRELENIIMAAVSFAKEGHVLTANHLNIGPRHEKSHKDYDFKEDGLELFLAKVEREIIEEALAVNGRNISRTASYLKIKRQTLQHKMKKYEIQA
ncbi:MAG: sigma 54-interacting transcriptional regulator [Firmicutes bacterium]|nr:sigma 54-interacting transcriptional regulator [Bacillota bacterium]